MTAAAEELRGRSVLITGGGFIGGRLAERLAGQGVDVLVLARTPGGADRLAGTGCRSVVGDVTDRATVESVVRGCHAVFHCAFGTSGSRRQRRLVNRVGTERVLSAAGDAGAHRVVHLSTVMVYGRTTGGDLTEDLPRRRYGADYPDSKLDAERVATALAASGRSPVVVLQPTNVYGPGAGVWGAQVLARMRSGLLPLVDGGVGVCNHVHVDDMVSAMVAAATGDRPVVGESFLVSAAAGVPWREFFGHFEDMVGTRRTVSVTEAAAREQWRRERAARPRLAGELAAALRGGGVSAGRVLRTREVEAARSAVSTLVPDRVTAPLRRRLGGARPVPANPDGPLSDKVLTLHPDEIDYYASRATVRIDKARRLLGYEPAVDLPTGMAGVARWAADAGLLGRHS